MNSTAINTECLSCFEKISSESIILPCNHAFCYDCLIESYKGKGCSYYSGSNHRICPYCRTPAPYLELKEGYTPMKGIHREYVSKSVYHCSAKCCKAVYKSGVNKGKPCTAKAKYGSDFCGRHKKQELSADT